jgi:ribosomal protein S18 acetylase RimI-like enzyme
MLSIITANLEHASLISELSIVTFFDTYAAYNTPENMQLHCDENFGVDQIAAQIQKEGNIFFIAFIDDVPAGFTKMRTSENPSELAGKTHIEIERIYVLKAFQKQKLGYGLIIHCIKYAVQSGFEVLWLGVWQQNTKALAFYQKNGFEIFGEHSFLLGDDDQTDWLMKMDLTNSKEGEVSG